VDGGPRGLAAALVPRVSYADVFPHYVLAGLILNAIAIMLLGTGTTDPSPPSILQAHP
jgi:hypothetical protein